MFLLFAKTFVQVQTKKTSKPVSLAFVRGIDLWLVDFPHKGPVTPYLYGLYISKDSLYIYNLKDSLTMNTYIFNHMQTQFYRYIISYKYFIYIYICIWVRSQRRACLVTWFCYHMRAKPGNKTVPPSWPDPYICVCVCMWVCVSVCEYIKIYMYVCVNV